jgi:hypothetical protein
MSKNPAKSAEHYFAMLCTDAGVTCNRSSDEDIAGWDYILHFPIEPNNILPMDEQPGAESALVQVKSINGHPFSVRIKLSNAQRMAKESLPYFIVLVVGHEPDRRVLARHFWVSEIESALKRVREAEASGQHDRLNRQRITFQLTDADDHTNDLLDWMQSTIRGISGDYRSSKNEITKTIGFEKNCARVELSISGSRDEYVDWELGIGEQPAISSYTFSRERFGIAIPDQLLNAPGGTISVKPEGQPCLLTLRHQSAVAKITFAGRLYVSRIASNVTEDPTWRANFGNISITRRANQAIATFNFDFSERKKLQDLIGWVTVLSWPSSGNIDATILAGGVTLELGAFAFPQAADVEAWKAMAKWTGSLQNLVDAVPGSNPEISISDLQNASHRLQYFHDVFVGGSMKIETDYDEKDDPTRAIIYRVKCSVGSWCFYAIVRRDVALDDIQIGRRALYLKPSELLEAFVFRGSCADNLVEVLSAYAQQVEQMGDPVFFWDLEDIDEWIAKMSPQNNGLL